MLHHRFLRPLNAWILATIMARVAMRVLTCLALSSAFVAPPPAAPVASTRRFMKKPRLCINQTSRRLRHRWIMVLTPSTRRLLDSVAVPVPQ